MKLPLVKKFLVVALLTLSLPARAELVDAIQSVVGESVITYLQIQRILFTHEGMLRMQSKGRAEDYRRLKMKDTSDALESMVNAKMIIHEYSSAGFKIPESIIDEFVQDRIHERFQDDRVQLTKKLELEGMTYEDYRKELRDEFIVGQMRMKFVPEPIISPLKVENYYTEHKTNFSVEDEVKLRMIVLNRPSDDTNGAVHRRMEEILSQIKGGATFADLAKSYSEGSQRAEGGETGWQETSKLNSILVDSVSKLKAGEYSDVIETPEADFLVLLEERHPAHVRPLTEVRADIEKSLIFQEKERLWERWMHRLKHKTFIQSF